MLPLLSTRLLVVLAGTSVLVVVVSALLGDRVPGGRPLRTGLRVISLLLAQVMAVGTCAVAVNDYGFFYGSWSELLGHQDRVAAVSRTDHVRTVPDGRGVVGGGGRVLGRAPFEAGSVPARDGKTVTVRLPGRRSGLAEIGFVHLPPEYFQPGWEHTQFPAVEVLTGYPGQATDLLKTLDVPAALRQDQRAGTAGPMVLVMLRSSPAFPRDTECVDVPRGPQAFTYYSQDVPADVASLFRVRPVGWGAMGDSTGGYCASKLAVTNSYVFPAAVALSGYAAPPQDLTTGDLFGGSASLRAQSDLVHLLRTGHSPAASLLLTTTRTERGPSGLDAVRTLQRAARPPLQVDTLIETRGGHSFSTWRPELPTVLAWLSSHLHPPRTATG